MGKAYEWALIKYPYLRTHNLFIAFVLTALSVGIVTSLSIESQAYFIRQEENKYNFQLLERENNQSGLHKPGHNIHSISTNKDDIYGNKKTLHRVLRVSLVSFLITFSVYILMYFIVGFGGGMVSMKRKFRLFSSIPAKKI
jgi:hypothetical protein